MPELSPPEDNLAATTGPHLSPRGLLRLTDGRATAAERRSAFEHMRRCTACAFQFEHAVSAERVMAGEPEGVPSAELDALLPGILDEVEPARAKAKLWVMLPALAVAAGGLLAVGLGLQAGAPGAAPGETPARDADGFSVRGEPDKVPELAGELLCVEEMPRPAARCPVGAEVVIALAPAPKQGLIELSFEDSAGTVHRAASEQAAAGAGLKAGRARLNAAVDEGVPAVWLSLDEDVAPGPGTVIARVCTDCGPDEAGALDEAGARVLRLPLTVAPAADAPRGEEAQR